MRRRITRVRRLGVSGDDDGGGAGGNGRKWIGSESGVPHGMTSVLMMHAWHARADAYPRVMMKMKTNQLKKTQQTQQQESPLNYVS
jgi:hypothetical protein